MAVQLNEISTPPSPTADLWRDGLPMLADGFVMLREIELADAAGLTARLARPKVSQFSEPSPSTVEGFRRYIRWTRLERVRGRHASFAIIPTDLAEPVGVIQLWRDASMPGVFQWGAVIDDRYWRRKIFTASARLLQRFAFSQAHAERLDAYVCLGNEAAHATFRRLGATRASTLHRLKVRGEGRLHLRWTIHRPGRCATGCHDER